MNLSPNFTLAEFTRSATAIRLGIDNTPTPAIIENLRFTASKLEEIRAQMAGMKTIFVNSGYRCLALNRAVGGSPTSAHVKGLAVDITAPRFYSGNVRKLCEFVASCGVEFDQLIYEFGPQGWCHIGFAIGSTPRREILSKYANTGYLPGIVDR